MRERTIVLLPTIVYWNAPKKDDEIASLLLMVDIKWIALVMVFITVIVIVMWVWLELLLVICNAKISDAVNNVCDITKWLLEKLRV